MSIFNADNLIRNIVLLVVTVNDDIFLIKMGIYRLTRLNPLIPDLNQLIGIVKQIIPDIRIVLCLQIQNFVSVTVYPLKLRVAVAMIIMRMRIDNDQFFISDQMPDQTFQIAHTK